VRAGQAEQSTLLTVLNQAVSRPDSDPGLAKKVAAVASYLAAAEQAPGPFLSVIVRTQGLRPEPFKDALLCLQAQSNEDFEVIVVVHNAEPENERLVRDAVRAMPSPFRKRVTVLSVEGGTRARPLNVGLAKSTGRYVAFYDDDDLLFAHWVESFSAAAKQYPGMLLRAVVANQRVIPERWAGGEAGFRSMSWPKPDWDSSFDLVGHLLVNKSPFMSWAFPRTLFTTLGVRFDEELLAAEDWDVIMQGAVLLGVHDVAQLTSVYRRWENALSSYTAHSTDEWQESERRVIARLNEMAIVMPAGSAEPLRTQALFDVAVERYKALFNGHELREPLLTAWKAAAPGLRFAVRVRNRIRRLRAR
jgi:hypothetical protein